VRKWACVGVVGFFNLLYVLIYRKILRYDIHIYIFHIGQGNFRGYQLLLRLHTYVEFTISHVKNYVVLLVSSSTS